MKKVIILLASALICLNISNIYGQKSASFKKIGNLYEQQTKIFFVDVFDLVKTGPEMAVAAQTEMEEMVYQCFLSDFALWAKHSKKYQGEKKFVLTLKGTKEYQTESTEYMNQFKKIQDEFVDNRLTWKQDELVKVLTKERLMKYITPIVEKFVKRTENNLTKLKSSYKMKKNNVFH